MTKKIIIIALSAILMLLNDVKLFGQDHTIYGTDFWLISTREGGIDSLDVFDSICHGEDYTEFGFNIIKPEVGELTDTITYTDEYGHKTFINLTLTVNQTYDTAFYDSICAGGSYHGHGFDTIQPPAGLCVMEHYFLTKHGCDSIITMNLFVNDTFNIVIPDTICHGGDYHKFNFDLKQPPVGLNIRQQFLKSEHRCDSIVMLRLYVAATYDTTFNEVLCEGEDYENHGLFIPEPKPGTHYLTSKLASKHGCDSIIHINLYVSDVFDTPDTIYGMTEVAAASSLISGIYKYHIDKIDGCKKYHWTVSNNSWVITPNGHECELLVRKPGSGVLRIEAQNTCSDVFKTLEITAGVYGVNENNETKTSVYPNPTNGNVNVEGNGIETINVINASGVIVKSYKFNREDLISIDLSELPSSIYILEIVSPEEKCIKRITKTGN